MPTIDFLLEGGVTTPSCTNIPTDPVCSLQSNYTQYNIRGIV